jgi:hypothetical protein
MSYTGGLCNKIFCLSAEIHHALNDKQSISEPNFGWKRKVKFSEIFDIEYFNKSVFKLTGFENIICDQRIGTNRRDLWSKSEALVYEQRKLNVLSTQDALYITLVSLKPSINMMTRMTTDNFQIGIHMRLESDWTSYAKHKEKAIPDNIFLVKKSTIAHMIKDMFDNKDNIFISTGMNHDHVVENLKNHGLHHDIHFFHDKKLEYEQNAYLNFLTLLDCNVFVGNSRSTFSNLVTMTRCIQQNNHKNYVYNTSNSKLVKRVDFGVHCDPKKVENNVVNFVKLINET